MKAILRRLLLGTAFAVVLTSAFNVSAFYDPTIGRWASRDPIGEEGDRNLYGFVLNNPVQYCDYLGQSIVNCLGHACIGGSLSLQPGSASLEDVLKLYGWKCKKATKCKCDCDTEDAAMIFVYIKKPLQWTQETPQKQTDAYFNSIRKQYSDVPLWTAQNLWDQDLSKLPIDFHGIRRNCKVKYGQDGAWDYVDGNQATEPDGTYTITGPESIGGVLSDPWKYWKSKKQVLLSMCCKRSKKPHVLD